MKQTNVDFFDLKVDLFMGTYIILKDKVIINKIKKDLWDKATIESKVLKINDLFKKVSLIKEEQSSKILNIKLFEFDNFNQLWLKQNNYLKV